MMTAVLSRSKAQTWVTNRPHTAALQPDSLTAAAAAPAFAAATAAAGAGAAAFLDFRNCRVSVLVGKGIDCVCVWGGGGGTTDPIELGTGARGLTPDTWTQREAAWYQISPARYRIRLAHPAHTHNAP
jgi:hypothetical protein